MTKTHCVNAYFQKIQFFATVLSGFEDFKLKHKKKIFETKIKVKKNSVTSSKKRSPDCDVISTCKKRTDKKKYHVIRSAHGAHEVSSEREHSRCSRGEQGERCSRRSISEQDEQSSIYEYI